jgi:Cu-Zn family superoxide dismutase
MRLRIVGFAITVACSKDVRPGTVPVEPTAMTDSENPAVTAIPERPIDREAGNVLVDPGADDPVRATQAIAILYPTRESSVIGVVRFRAVEGELHVFAAVEGLPGTAHAYHVHVFGDCSATDASSAGPHFHYTGSSFDDRVRMVTGNLGELRRDNGRATTIHRASIPGATLHGPYSIVGRSVVVHERGNDPAITPDGGAGRRLACGVIGVAGHPQPGPIARQP